MLHQQRPTVGLKAVPSEKPRHSLFQLSPSYLVSAPSAGWVSGGRGGAAGATQPTQSRGGAACTGLSCLPAASPGRREDAGSEQPWTRQPSPQGRLLTPGDKRQGTGGTAGPRPGPRLPVLLQRPLLHPCPLGPSRAWWDLAPGLPPPASLLPSALSSDSYSPCSCPGPCAALAPVSPVLPAPSPRSGLPPPLSDPY